MRLRELYYRLRDQFWLVPLLFAATAVAAAIGITLIDGVFNSSIKAPYLFRGGPEGARSVLSSIIQSMISFTGLVFSITIVALQLTSSQFSPRILRTFLRDRVTQIALGTFVATFMYAIVVLRSVRGTAGDNPAVPQIAVTVSVLLVAVSTVVFILYIHHTAQSMRIATIIARIGADTRRLIEKEYGPADSQDDPEPTPDMGESAIPDGRRVRVCAARQGVVQRIDGGLTEIARRHHLTIRLLRSIGEFVPSGAALMDVLARDGDLDVQQLREAVQLGNERSLDQDVGFGIRELVDIAEKALSPGVNDPTTAVQAIDQIHDLMRRLVTRRLVPKRCFDDGGRLLVDIPRAGIDEFLRLALQEIVRWGGDVARICDRLEIMLDDLLTAARPEYRPHITAAAAAFGLDTDPSSRRPSDLGLR